jgi:hypothetical protein
VARRRDPAVRSTAPASPNRPAAEIMNPTSASRLGAEPGVAVGGREGVAGVSEGLGCLGCLGWNSAARSLSGDAAVTHSLRNAMINHASTRQRQTQARPGDPLRGLVFVPLGIECRPRDRSGDERERNQSPTTVERICQFKMAMSVSTLARFFSSSVLGKIWNLGLPARAWLRLDWPTGSGWGQTAAPFGVFPRETASTNNPEVCARR